jgi:hypothetical protein
MEDLQNDASIQMYLKYKVVKNLDKFDKFSPTGRKFTKQKKIPFYSTKDINELPAILMVIIAPCMDISKTSEFDISCSLGDYILKGINNITAAISPQDLSIRISTFGIRMSRKLALSVKMNNL